MMGTAPLGRLAAAKGWHPERNSHGPSHGHRRGMTLPEVLAARPQRGNEGQIGTVSCLVCSGCSTCAAPAWCVRALVLEEKRGPMPVFEATCKSDFDVVRPSIPNKSPKPDAASHSSAHPSRPNPASQLTLAWSDGLSANNRLIWINRFAACAVSISGSASVS